MGVNLIHFIVWLAGLISVPTLVIVKILTKHKFVKALVITLGIVALLTAISAGYILLTANNYLPRDAVLGENSKSFGITYEENQNIMPSALPPSDNYPKAYDRQGMQVGPFTTLRYNPSISSGTMINILIGGLIVLFVPVVATYHIINHVKKKWSKRQIWLLIFCTLFVLDILLVFTFINKLTGLEYQLVQN